MTATPTLSDIAEATGIDRGTVSRILRGLGDRYRISDDRQAAVRAVAEELGYRPDFYAARVGRGRFAIVGLLVVSTGENWLPPPLMTGINAALAGRGYALQVTVADPDVTDADPADRPPIFDHRMVDGLLVAAQLGHCPGVAAWLAAEPLPAIALAGFPDRPEVDGVVVDNEAAAIEVADRLLAHGHRRVGLAGSDPTAIRLAACRRRLEAAGATTTTMTATGDRLEAVATAALADDDRPTAIVTPGLQATCAVLAAARVHGLRIGRDLSMVDFGPDTPSPVDRMVVDERERGRVGTGMLLAAIDADGADQPSRHLPMTFRSAGSLGPAG